MATHGFSSTGLARWAEGLRRHVGSNSLPGLIALVARGGEPHVEIIGTAGFGEREPLRRDALFRIASLSKPLVAAAALTMVEDGTLALDRAVDGLLPELADRRVLRRLDGPLDDTVPAARPVTVHDLLTYRLGFGNVMAPPGSFPIQRAEAELGLATLGPPWPPPPFGPDEWIRRFATLPLMLQPGEGWLYNTSAQVLGVLLERAAGEPLETVLRRRLFDPLGMVDTAFSVPADKRHRMTTAYQPDPETGVLTLLDGVQDSMWGQPPAMPNAAGWLVSTLDDYWSFVRMLRDGGVGPAGRVLFAHTVASMLTDQLTAEQRSAATLFLEGGGWGLGLRVPAAVPGSTVLNSVIPAGTAPTSGIPFGTVPVSMAGDGYGWDGGTGTTWRTVPGRGLTGILFTQRAKPRPNRHPSSRTSGRARSPPSKTDDGCTRRRRPASSASSACARFYGAASLSV